jgi:hypothetical protein
MEQKWTLFGKNIESVQPTFLLFCRTRKNKDFMRNHQTYMTITNSLWDLLGKKNELLDVDMIFAK